MSSVCSTMSDRLVQLGQAQRFLEGLRVLIVGGISAGVILIGVGSRLAMLLLRVASPDNSPLGAGIRLGV
jgi:hypothetical protein